MRSRTKITAGQSAKASRRSSGRAAISSDDHFDEFTFMPRRLRRTVARRRPSISRPFSNAPRARRPGRKFPRPQPIGTRPEEAGARVADFRHVPRRASRRRHDHHGAGAAAGTDTVKVGDITVASPWTRATPGGAKVAGGYLKLTNNGRGRRQACRRCTDIAGRVEIHEMAMNGGVMQMRPLNDGPGAEARSDRGA